MTERALPVKRREAMPGEAVRPQRHDSRVRARRCGARPVASSVAAHVAGGAPRQQCSNRPEGRD